MNETRSGEIVSAQIGKIGAIGNGRNFPKEKELVTIKKY